MELSLRGLFQDFNASKCIVYGSLLVFTLLFALKLDGTIDVPYWCIFLSLWLWKLVAIAGAVVGCVSHCRRPPPRQDVQSELEYRTMILCAGQHVLLFMFEILACYKLDTQDPELKWILVFVPLVFESIISIIICVWAVRQDRSFEFELFFSVNAVQFAFVALKLDNMVHWNWAVIFIPLWILICLSLIAVLYAVILAVLLIRSISLLPERRRQHMWSAIAYTLLVVPLLVFLVLLTGKLDGERMGDQAAAALPYTIVCTPLFVSLACLTLMACGARTGNQWWFGMRADVCVFLLDTCPCLQQYGNVSYKFGSRRNSVVDDQPDNGNQQLGSSRAQVRPDSVEMALQHQSRSSSKDFKHVMIVPTIEAPD